MEARGKELIRAECLNFSYPGGDGSQLAGVDFCLRAGEAVLITGPTGCGKSTLLKALSGIIPRESSGTMTGQVLVEGLDTRRTELSEISRRVGLVFQSPDDQLCCTRVADEVAFGPANLGVTGQELEERVSTALSQVGLTGFEAAEVQKLSGGQKQRVAIAAQLAMRPSVLALDEPISQLDPGGAAEVMQCLKALLAGGMAVVVVEHRLTEVLCLVERVMVMEAGRMILDTPCSDLVNHLHCLERLGLKVPDELKAASILGDDFLARAINPPAAQPEQTNANAPVLLRLDKASFRYDKGAEPALREVSLEVRQGEVLAIIGGNGSGKSTCLSLMAGLNQPSGGRVSWQDSSDKKPQPGQVGILFQNPDLLLLETSLERELLSGPRLMKLPRGPEIAGEMAENIGLAEYLAQPPWALSKGQRLRAALGAILTTRPKVLLLDEPTTGQNQANIHRLLAGLKADENIRAIVLCSHDMDAVARYADRIAVLYEGRLEAIGPTRRILKDYAMEEACGLRPHWPLRHSKALNLGTPMLTIDEVIKAYGCYPCALNPLEPAPCDTA